MSGIAAGARTSSMPGLAGLLGVVVVLAAFAIVLPAPVDALSCASVHPRERLDRGDAAVIARFLGPSEPKRLSDPMTPRRHARRR